MPDRASSYLGDHARLLLIVLIVTVLAVLAVLAVAVWAGTEDPVPHGTDQPGLDGSGPLSPPAPSADTGIDRDDRAVLAALGFGVTVLIASRHQRSRNAWDERPGRSRTVAGFRSD